MASRLNFVWIVFFVFLVLPLDEGDSLQTSTSTGFDLAIFELKLDLARPHDHRPVSEEESSDRGPLQNSRIEGPLEDWHEKLSLADLVCLTFAFWRCADLWMSTFATSGRQIN